MLAQFVRNGEHSTGCTGHPAGRSRAATAERRAGETAMRVVGQVVAGSSATEPLERRRAALPGFGRRRRRTVFHVKHLRGLLSR